MKEAELLARVTGAAKLYGFKVWHVPAPMRWAGGTWVGAKEAAGIADLILIHDDPPRLIFAELKGTGGELSDAQLDFLQAVKIVAGETADLAHGDGSVQATTLGVYLVTPETEDTFLEVLRSKVLW